MLARGQIPSSISSSPFCRRLRTRRPQMASSEPLPPRPPENRVVLGCGATSVDFLATVASFPNPDDKIRSLSLKVEGGGNAGNALTGAARLGLKPRIISKVANDAQGINIIKELEADGVDTSYLVVAEKGNSPFTYIIVDNETKTRTCIHTPGWPEMIPEELSASALSSALDDASLVYFDGRLHRTALVVAQEACQRRIPMLVDAERKREGLDDLLNLASYVVCSENFPQSWTSAPSIPTALLLMLLRLPNLQFVIVTRGDKGSVMLERSLNVTAADASRQDEVDIDDLFQSLQQEANCTATSPTCLSSKLDSRICTEGIGPVTGRLLLCTAEHIPPAELIDTTGAGDAFIGSVLYALCAGMRPERMLPFASQVAAAGCRALGARSGLPWHSDPRLTKYLMNSDDQQFESVPSPEQVVL